MVPKKKKKWEFPFFVPKTIKNFGYSYVFLYPCDRKCDFFFEFLMKNVANNFGITMSSLGGVLE